jgi:Fur family ferric uptake transcriptional regulator
MNTQLYSSTLKKNRLSNTRARRTVFDILDAQNNPLTMKQLVNAASPTLDRSTVYRTIELFEHIGIVTKVYTGWKYRIELSDIFSSHHHHLTCTACGTIISFEDSNHFDNELHQIATKHGFSLSAHSLELKGLCRACR